MVKTVQHVFILGTMVLSTKTSFAAKELYDNDAFWVCYGLGDLRIGDHAYYEDPSISQYGYSWHTSTARLEWDKATAADIDWYKVSNYDTASTRFFAGDYTWASYYGKMQAYKGNGDAVLDSELSIKHTVFYRTHVLINNYEMDKNNLSGTLRAETVTHEVGHVLNMKHQDNAANSIMKKNDWLYSYTPTSVDYRNVNYKY